MLYAGAMMKKTGSEYMANMTCPTCGKQYKGLARYCSQCGIELAKDKNRCSRRGTSLCRDAEFADDDIFCCYCGALTTFAEERKARGDILPVVPGD